MQRNGDLFYMKVEDHNTIKERDKQKREAISNLYYLKDISRETFESQKAELKGDGKNSSWFFILKISYYSPNKAASLFRNYKEQKYAYFYLAYKKVDTVRKALNRLNICFKNAADLGLDVDLQATETARALLGKQRHKT